MRDWGAVAFLFVLVAALTLAFFLLGRSPKPGGPPPPQAPAAQAQAPGGAGDETAQFWLAVKDHAPLFIKIGYECLVCGTKMELPEKKRGNRLGGVATDVMSLALAPNPSGTGRPDMSQQDFDLLWGTCPKCGATYAEYDMPNLRLPKFADRLKKWDLQQIAPPLASTPKDKWSDEVRILAHYLTQKQAGIPVSELGFSALTGAYSSNLSVYLGRKHAIPADAFYALSAARLAEALKSDTTLFSTPKAVTAMTLGEVLRLLGRVDEARAAFAQARSLYEEKPQVPLSEGQQKEKDNALAVLKQLEDLLAQGDTNLERAEVPDLPRPPIGWYLDEMLPAMNGDIIYYRKDWSAPVTAEEIEARIIKLLAAM